MFTNKFVMENQEILDMNLAGSYSNSNTKVSVPLEKPKIFSTDPHNK